MGPGGRIGKDHLLHPLIAHGNRFPPQHHPPRSPRHTLGLQFGSSVTQYSNAGRGSDSWPRTLEVPHLGRVGSMEGPETGLALGEWGGGGRVGGLGPWRCRLSTIGDFEDLGLLWKPEALKSESCLFSDIAVAPSFMDLFLPQTSVAALCRVQAPASFGLCVSGS